MLKEKEKIESWNIELNVDNVPISMHLNVTEDDAETILQEYLRFWKELYTKVEGKKIKLHCYIKNFPTKEYFFPFKTVTHIV
jgi:hypothetical protein